MVKIRFSRHGAKKHAFYHIVVTDSEAARDAGRFIEQIGTYDPSKPMTQAKIDRDRLQHWLSKGAQVTVGLKKVIREQSKVAVAAT